MSLFEYSAFDKSGKKQKGVIEAATQREAKEKIANMSLILLELHVSKRKRMKFVVSQETLIIFTSQLAQMLSSKIPLYESLIALEEQYRQERFHPVILGITERVKSGISLSNAMQDFPESFPPLYRALIASGEAVGALDETAKKLSAFLEQQNSIRKKLISALTYPALLFSLMVLVVAVLVWFVIPSLETLFEDRTLPMFTQIVLGISHFIRNWAYLFVPGIFTLCFVCWHQIKKPALRARLDYFILQVPFFKTIILHIALARFARILATLLDGGLTLAHALPFARKALQNSFLEELFEKAEEKIIEGVEMSYILERSPIIPPLFSRMIKVGEESGRLSNMLNQVAYLYEEDTSRTIERALTLLQPLLLIIMGALVALVLLSILIPLSDFGSQMTL